MGFKDGYARILNLNSIDYFDLNKNVITFYKISQGVLTTDGYFRVSYNNASAAKQEFDNVIAFLDKTGQLVDIDKPVTNVIVAGCGSCSKK
jgi:hypothetical protein